jgi:hypothetical protein
MSQMLRISFDPKFERLPTGYLFNVLPESIDTETWPCEGILVGGQNHVSDTDLWAMPDTCKNEDLIKNVLNSWYDDCKRVFKKPFNVTGLYNKVTNVVDKDFSIAALSPEEEEQEWNLLWVPSRLELRKNEVVLLWAPTHKKPGMSRIIEDFEVQSPEESQYRIIANAEYPATTDASWIQDISQLPLSDSPALRLEMDLDSAKERMRRRVRDSRLRAKLARYRAERLAQSFLERYGVYPEPDADEIETEYEQSSSQSDE